MSPTPHDAALETAVINPPLAKRFWDRVDFKPGGKCWLWTGSLSDRGYGYLRHEGRIRRATHLSWEYANGASFPAGMFACHHCDNPPCVNPEHLFVGTARDNSLDMVAKGRAYKPAPTAICTRCGHHRTDDCVEKTGVRRCRVCVRDRQRVRAQRARARRRAQVPA